MAHAARIGALTDELVELVAGYSPTENANRFKSCKDAALKTLKWHRFGSTNEFSVRNSLNGLIEKFQVRDNDALADALQFRLKELTKQPTKWTSDVLSLLLQLSESPVEHGGIEGLSSEQPFEPKPEPEPQLTWADIDVDDPVQDGQIWQNVNFSAYSSDDDSEDQSETSSDHREDTLSTLVTEDGNEAALDALLEDRDESTFRGLEQSLRKTTSAPQTDQRTLVSELALIRDVLSMLSGLPSRMFDHVRVGEISTNKLGRLENVSDFVLDAMLEQTARIGTAVCSSRISASRTQRLAVLQRFSHSIRTSVEQFDLAMTSLQSKFVGLTTTVNVSLLDVLTQVSQAAETLVELRDVIVAVKSGTMEEALSLLDMLFSKTCDAESDGRTTASETVGKIFFACLQAYMKPIESWMNHGEISDKDSVFFVAINSNSTGLEEFWSDRYSLRKREESVQAPGFIHGVVREIFAAGKSVAFLKLLGSFDLTSAREFDLSSCLNFDGVCFDRELLQMLPFSLLFTRTLHGAIKTKHSQNSILLRETLVKNCDFQVTANALEHLFLGKDGSSFDEFAGMIFAKLDARKSIWNIPYFLEEAAQKSFGGLDCLNERAITAAPITGAYQGKEYSLKAFSNIALHYEIPWPVANIIRPESIQTYQRVFTMLLQIRRARKLLDQMRFRAVLQNTSDRNSESHISLYSMRQRLLWFVILVQDHLTATAIMTCSKEFQTNSLVAEDVDAMITAHEMFIKDLEKRTLLSKDMASSHQAIVSMLELALLFAEVWLTRMKASSQIEVRASKDYGSDSELDYEHSPAHYSERVKFGNTTASDAQLRHISSQFNHLLSILVADLRHVSKVEDRHSSCEVLAARLESGLANNQGPGYS